MQLSDRFLIFLAFLGLFVSNFSLISGFRLKSCTKRPKKGQTIKVSKICSIAAQQSCRCSPMPIFSPNGSPNGSKKLMAAKIRIQISAIFLYKLLKTAENDLTSRNRISAWLGVRDQSILTGKRDREMSCRLSQNLSWPRGNDSVDKPVAPYHHKAHNPQTFPMALLKMQTLKKWLPRIPANQKFVMTP